MKTRKSFIFTLLIIIQVGILCGCTKKGIIISETNHDTEIQMEVSKYTGYKKRDITIKNTQSGSFSIQYSPSAGKININLIDGDGKNLLSMNEQATMQDYQPLVTNIKEGNGTYHLTVDMKEYTGSLSITWDITQAEVKEEPTKKVEPTKASAVSEKKRTEFQSDFGYTLSYEEDRVDYRKTTGYDQFVLKSEDLDAPFVFVSISRVEAERVDLVKNAALSEDRKPCVIGKAKLSGEYSETKEVWDGGETIHKTYMCPLASGDALLIETQWYTEEADTAYAAWVQEMLDSIQVEEEQAVSDDVTTFGILTEYEEKSRQLHYIPIEIVDEADSKRIKELTEQGLELDFPNGYYIYEPNTEELSFPVDESVVVSLLNEECMLQDSNMEEIANRLEGHPEFFLCQIHLYEGTIMDIKEHFLP